VTLDGHPDGSAVRRVRSTSGKDWAYGAVGAAILVLDPVVGFDVVRAEVHDVQCVVPVGIAVG
jgi:hypothetical protein